ncbi:hypothetical protein C8R43DRAFT_1142154 [Mycena crocata]|nr:hypothetical protein C8R43DRAFT_1142154 [Mycena crocata]
MTSHKTRRSPLDPPTCDQLKRRAQQKLNVGTARGSYKDGQSPSSSYPGTGPCCGEEEASRGDADHREHLRARKFWERYGKEAYYGFYHPQYKLLGKRHLPGLYFGPDEQAELKRVRKELEKQKLEKSKGSKKARDGSHK